MSHPTEEGHTVSLNQPLANVTEAGDIVVYTMALVAILVVGLALLGLDAAVGRLGRRRARKRLLLPEGRAEQRDRTPE